MSWVTVLTPEELENLQKAASWDKTFYEIYLEAKIDPSRYHHAYCMVKNRGWPCNNFKKKQDYFDVTKQNWIA